jgi:hypothetical protein
MEQTTVTVGALGLMGDPTRPIKLSFQNKKDAFLFVNNEFHMHIRKVINMCQRLRMNAVITLSPKISTRLQESFHDSTLKVINLRPRSGQTKTNMTRMSAVIPSVRATHKISDPFSKSHSIIFIMNCSD